MKKKFSSKRVEDFSLALIQAWRSLTSLSGPPTFLQTREFRLCALHVRQIQDQLKKGAVFRIFWQESLSLGAYMLYFWPIHYQQALTLLLRESSVGVLWVFESGAGAYAVAGLEARALDVSTFESQERCRMMVSTFVAKLGHTLNSSSWSFPDLPQREQSVDTVLLGHTLDLETNSAKETELWVDWMVALTHKLNRGGKIFLVETNDLVHKKRIEVLKQALESKLKQTSLESIGTVENLVITLQTTQLMRDLMRSSRRPDLQQAALVWKLQRS